jgi:hypothetical protein
MKNKRREEKKKENYEYNHRTRYEQDNIRIRSHMTYQLVASSHSCSIAIAVKNSSYNQTIGNIHVDCVE